MLPIWKTRTTLRLGMSTKIRRTPPLHCPKAYYLPRTERDGAALMKWDGKESSQHRANENCHSYLLGAEGKVDRNKLEKTTADMEFNPHGTHHANLEMQCTTCHKGHRASVVACTGCHEHENVAVPDGWLTYQQSQDLMAKSFGNK